MVCSEESSGNYTGTARYAQVPVVATDVCKFWDFGFGVTISVGMLCAGGNGADSCQGDSGGPLYGVDEDENAVLLGVVSYGKKDGSTKAKATTW